jgi:hypothetical protein
MIGMNHTTSATTTAAISSHRIIRSFRRQYGSVRIQLGVENVQFIAYSRAKVCQWRAPGGVYKSPQGPLLGFPDIAAVLIHVSNDLVEQDCARNREQNSDDKHGDHAVAFVVARENHLTMIRRKFVKHRELFFV